MQCDRGKKIRVPKEQIVNEEEEMKQNVNPKRKKRGTVEKSEEQKDPYISPKNQKYILRSGNDFLEVNVCN